MVAVVAGDHIACAQCPKRAVRRISDISEAKWNTLLETQKRRLFECFADNEHLSFGYALFTRDQLHTLENYHLLYQDVNLSPAWDLALEGYAYGEILFEMGAREEHRCIFTFDRIASKKQSEAVAQHVRHFVPDTKVFIEGSRQNAGIQAADCLAGAVAEDFKRDTNWLDYLSDHDLVECSPASLVQLENDLTSY